MAIKPVGKVRNQLLEDYLKYTELSQVRRGKFLNEIIFLERCIDEYLAKFFCSTKLKQQLILSLFLRTEKGTLRFKIELVLFIINKYDKQFKKLYPNYISEINGIVKIRNEFAHAILDETNPIKFWSDKKTVFINHKNPEHATVITEQIFKEKLETCEKYKTAFQFYGKYSAGPHEFK